MALGQRDGRRFGRRVDDREIEVRFGVFGFDRDGAAQGLFGFAELPDLARSHTEIVEGDRVVGLGLVGALEVTDGIVDAVLLDHDRA